VKWVAIENMHFTLARVTLKIKGRKKIKISAISVHLGHINSMIATKCNELSKNLKQYHHDELTTIAPIYGWFWWV